MKKNNYIDTLKILAKKNKSDEIISLYEDFGWIVESKNENRHYEDIFDISFTRQHSIKNKDELQLLQVHMEERLNAQAKLEKNKHSKLTAFSLCFGVLGIFTLVFCIIMSFNLLPHVGIISGSISMFVGLSLFLVGGLTMPKVYKIENEYFKNESKRLKVEIENISKRAQTLSGGKHE